MKKRIKIVIIIFLLLGFVLSACKVDAPSPTPVIVHDVTPPPAVETQPLVEETQVEPTQIEQIQAHVVLYAPVEVDLTLSQSFDAQLQEYTAQNGLSYERHEAISPDQLSAQTQLVVALISMAEARNLAENNSHLQVLTVGEADEVALPNLHVLNQTQSLPEHQSFIAGLILALSIPEYRVGVISQSNTEAGSIARDGFVTGARYYCGLCVSRYAPVIYYPIVAEIGSQAEWQVAADSLLAQSVKAVFVQPELSSAELFQYLDSHGIAVVAIEGQAGLEVAQNVVAVLRTGAITDIKPFVERLLSNEPLGVIKTGLELSQIDETRLTPGKQILFYRYLEDLLNGEIKALP